MIWFRDYSLEFISGLANQRGLVKLLNIEITEIGADFLCAKMPITPDLLQVHGIMHGGATCVLVESAGSIASGMCLDPSKLYAVGSQIHVNHLRPIKSGVVIARCNALHVGRQKHVWDVPIYSEESGKLIAKGELTCAVVSHAALEA